MTQSPATLPPPRPPRVTPVNTEAGAITPIEATLAKKKYRMADRWPVSAQVTKEGYVPVSTFFLRNYHQLGGPGVGLTHGEAMFIVHLFENKWDEKNPWPSCRTLAEKMAISDKSVRRISGSLERKGVLKRIYRKDAVKGSKSNEYDLSPLFAMLSAAATTLTPKRRKGEAPQPETPPVADASRPGGIEAPKKRSSQLRPGKPVRLAPSVSLADVPTSNEATAAPSPPAIP